MNLRPLLACLVLLSVAGCQQLLPVTDSVEEEAYYQTCHSEIPDFSLDGCLLDDWIAFGLASQQGDSEWREGMREKVGAERADQRLARAVLLAWGNDGERSQASSLLRADLSTAPPRLQPLLSYWLNELEERREASARLAEARSARSALNAVNKDLNAELEALNMKIEALTDIERNINLRQQTE
jgi:hypothetical protein